VASGTSQLVAPRVVPPHFTSKYKGILPKVASGTKNSKKKFLKLKNLILSLIIIYIYINYFIYKKSATTPLLTLLPYI